MKHWLRALALLLLLAFSMGCSLNDGETRKITAIGFWGVVMGAPIGIGYWHSERGPGEYIKSEISAKPAFPRASVP